MVSKPWKFGSLPAGSGGLLQRYFKKRKLLQARFDSFLRRLRMLDVPWHPTYYGSVGDSVGELRVDFQNVEYRFYGYFGPGPGEFTVIHIGDDKKRQQEAINDAKKLKKQIDAATGTPRVEKYDV